ncbi:amino acid adenylation domain-containing protein [Chondrocystis sp. NIES-4102]|nr:amino acid adenylation domain-containing protein [Chondrocystis sp. NIES-4102]
MNQNLLPVYRHFEQYAQQSPNSVAITFASKQITYGELNFKANQLANYLISLKVKPQDCIGVLVEPGFEILVAILAIHKLNGIYLPIDPEFPLARIKSIVEQAKPAIILCASQKGITVETSLSSLNINTVDLPSLDLSSYETNNLNYDCPLDSISHIFFTSGTTGTPKGVVSSHQNLIHYLFSAQAKYHFKAEDSFLSATRFTFSISLFMLLLPLVSGGRVEMITQEELLEPSLLAKAIEQSTFFHLGPSILRIFLDFLEQQPKLETQSRFAHVKHASSGGDMIPPSILNRLNQIFTNAEVYAIYGSSEISCMGCTYFVPRNLNLKQTLVGKPFDNVQLRVLDTQQKDVAVGIKGEIYFAGAGITSGYLNLPQLTQEKYILLDGQRFYRTGDLGCLTAEGDLQVLGRSDFQVQIRGQRIELADIEANLNLHPGIINSVVVAKEDHNQEQQLVAYFITIRDFRLTQQELRNFLVELLPQYMIPSQFILLEQFPLTFNGKVDRQALQALKQTKTESKVAPRSELEKQLVNIWAEVLHLQIEDISIEDNFFALGGHSLLATQVISRIRDSLQVEISLRSLFELVTIAQLAPKIEVAQTVSSLEPISLLTDRSQMPLSLAQQRLWILYQIESQSSAYNIPLALELKGKVDIKILKSAIAEIVSRHEVLRTRIQVIEEIPYQVVEPEVTIELAIIDLQALPELPKQAEYQRLATIETDRYFNLTEDFLLRTTLVQLTTNTQVLLVTMHHIISDGWSLEVFTQELASIYTALMTQQAISLPSLPFQYGDFAHWHRQWSESTIFSTQLAYWQQQLAALPTLLELPTDHPRPAVQSFSGRIKQFSLSPQLSKKLQQLSQQAGATLFMTLLTTFAALLSRYSNSQDIAIGSPIANRHRRELESLIGFFVNTLVLRTNLEGKPSFWELLGQVRQTTLDAYANQDVPFDKLVEVLQPERSLSHNPLFQVMFILQNHTATTKEMCDVTVTPLLVEQVTAQFDLTLSMTETSEGLTGFWQYNSDLFEPETIDRMTGHFEMLLTGITNCPEQPVANLPLLTTVERHQLLNQWNDTQKAYADEQCIHQLIEAQVARTPNEIAVVFEDQELTYAQLNCRVNQLARHLQQLGVKAETLVGVSLERSHLMLIALLAVLKAGGAYVPLDPNYPPDRLALMVEDSELAILLTTQASANVISDYSGKTICLDTQWSDIALNSGDNLASVAQPDNLAYIIYTSGSTGKPKGVQLEHRGVVNFLQSMQTEPGITHKDILLAVTSISFDIAVLELFLPLIVGAKVVIAAQQVTGDASQLLDLMLNSQATIMQATPATWRMLAAAKWEEVPRLKMLCGGEPLAPDLAQLMLQRCSSLWNVYGPTEATVWATIHEVKPDFDLIPIGHPLANTQVRILDAHGQLLPIGVAGEIHLGGVQLARGYLNRPELTQERFIFNATDGEQLERLYKTGDLGRYLPDGNVECLGRIDNQVKIRGFRIELGEIEANLALHPLVRNCVVVAREDVPGDKRIVAYIVAETNSIKGKELRQFLELSLPHYMIPSHFVILECFPLTPNGKIDRRALPAPLTSSATEIIAPRNELEQKLAEIWQQVLNVDSISVTDNFFDLGGHSLLAVALFEKIEQTFKRKIPLATLFKAPTIEQLGEILGSQTNNFWDCLVLLKTGDLTLTPLFLIHDADGEIMLYSGLSKYLTDNRPVYGIRPYSREGFPTLHTRIPDMANYYVQQIRKVQPQGPYLLGGLCAGGVLAFEIACQLQAQGEQVPFVGIIDAIDVEELNFHDYVITHRMSSLSEAISKKSQMSKAKQIIYLLNTLTKKLKNLIIYEASVKLEATKQKLKIMLFRYYLDRGLKLPQFCQNISVKNIYEKAREEYKPPTFRGKLTLWRAMGNTNAYLPFDDTAAILVSKDPYFGWGKRSTDGVESFDVPGGHSSMLQEPNVQILAEKMQAYIDFALTEQETIDGIDEVESDRSFAKTSR